MLRGTLPSQLLLATDFDGTLAPLGPQPQAARALPAILASLDRLVDAGVHVAVVSERAQADLSRLVPTTGARLFGENGLGEATRWERRALDRFNARAGRLIAREPGVWLEAKACSSSVQFYRAPAVGPELRAALLPIAEQLGLVATAGRTAVTARPSRADRTRVISLLLAALEPQAVIYAGADATDPVFDQLSGLASCHLTVGVCSPAAEADAFAHCDTVLDGPQGLAVFFGALLEWATRFCGEDPCGAV